MFFVVEKISRTYRVSLHAKMSCKLIICISPIIFFIKMSRLMQISYILIDL